MARSSGMDTPALDMTPRGPEVLVPQAFSLNHQKFLATEPLAVFLHRCDIFRSQTAEANRWEEAEQLAIRFRRDQRH